MTADGRRRAAAWGGRLLLLLALLLGFTAMHTLGHHTGDHHATAPASAGATTAGQPAQHTFSGFPGSSGFSGHQAGRMAVHAPHDPHGGAADRDDVGPGHGFDPLTVCLAVLALGSAAVLLVTGAVFLARRMRQDTPSPAARLLPPTLLALPPPPRHAIRLARLSLLRI